MNNFGEKVNFLWSIAELLRDRFKRGKYQDVILPFTVLRRIDCVLAPTKGKVLDVHGKLKGKLQAHDSQKGGHHGGAFPQQRGPPDRRQGQSDDRHSFPPPLLCGTSWR
jgi:type I restriction enzyme M protein